MGNVILSASKWTPIGPAPLQTAGGLGAISGRVTSVAADPTDPTMIYIGGDNGGVWKKSGLSDWVPLTDDMSSLNVSGYHPLVVHPADHNLVLCCVSGQGAGILKSTDGGANWQLLANNQFDQQSILAIAVHPTDTKTMYIAVGWRGVWKSTDGGSTWHQLTNNLPGGIATDLVIARFNPDFLYVGITGNSGSSQTQNGVYQSTDGGANWKQLGGGLPTGDALLSGSAGIHLESGSGLGVVYVSELTVDATGNVTAVQRFNTADGGTTWKALRPSIGPKPEFRNWHLVLAVDPGDDDHIFANDAYFLNESTDGGGSWSQADLGVGYLSGGSNSFDWVNVAFDSNLRALLTADQGVFRYDPKNPKKNLRWSSLVDNLQVSQFYTIGLDPQNVNVAYAVGQDIFSEKFTGAVQWNLMEGAIGETGRILVDPQNDNQVCGFSPLDLDKFVMQSSNRGSNWSPIVKKSDLSPAFVAIINAQSNNTGSDYKYAYAAQKAFVMDPSNPARVLVGTDQVLESTNIGSASPTFASISPTLSKDPAQPFVIALAIAPSDGSTVYAASWDRHLWVTYNDGASWVPCETGLSGQVVDLSVDPKDKNHVIAVTNDGVWELDPSTLVWSNITSNLRAGYFGLNTIFVDWRWSIPRIFVGTGRGIYQSVSLGQSWAKYDPALPNASVNHLQGAFYGPPGNKHLVLAAATFGRGAWEILIRRWGAVATAIADNGNFGPVCQGSFKDELLTINNIGPGRLLIFNITSSSPDFLAPSVVSYPLLVEPAASIDVAIRFQPTGTGSKSATITVTSNDPTGPHKFAVSGDAPTPRLTSMIANAGNFGSACVGSFVDEPLTLNNSGSCPLSIVGINSSSSEFMVPAVVSYPLVVAPGGSLQVPIRFQPTSHGPKSDVLTVSSNDPANPQTIAVTGVAPSGQIAVTGSICFGGVEACCCAERTISICNVGDCDLRVSRVAFKHKSRHWKLVNNPFPATLHSGSFLAVVVRYKATEKCPRCCELVIESDDPMTPVKIVELSAYTIWNKCCCKECCEDCKKGYCDKHHKECCCGERHDCCCDEDPQEEDPQEEDENSG